MLLHALSAMSETEWSRYARGQVHCNSMHTTSNLPNLAQFVFAKLLGCNQFPQATAVEQQGNLVGMWNLYRAEEWALPGDMVATWHPAELWNPEEDKVGQARAPTLGFSRLLWMMLCCN